MKLLKSLPLLLGIFCSPAFASHHCAKFISVREYEVTDSSEIAPKAQKEFVPIINKIPGFISWQLIAISKTRLITVSEFTSQHAAEVSAEKAKEWGKKALADLVKGFPEISNGKVIASSCK